MKYQNRGVAASPNFTASWICILIYGLQKSGLNVWVDMDVAVIVFVV